MNMDIDNEKQLSLAELTTNCKPTVEGRNAVWYMCVRIICSLTRVNYFDHQVSANISVDVVFRN